MPGKPVLWQNLTWDDLCVGELAQQLTQALAEVTPLETAGITPPPF